MQILNMREQFVRTCIDLMEENPKVVLVLAEISVSTFNDMKLPPSISKRIINVGIREQLVVGVASGLAKEGFMPIIHTYVPFLVERPYEQLKIDFGHEGVKGVFVSIGASYDAPDTGRTHHSPGDVAIIQAMPDWDVFVPGHGGEVDTFMRHAVTTNQNTYIRLSTQTNSRSHMDASLEMIETKSSGSGNFVVAVGPMLDVVLDAVKEMDVTVLYAPTLKHIDASVLAARGKNIVLVEPYLSGTSAALLSNALYDRPHRLLCLGVKNIELRNYGEPHEHSAVHGLDRMGIERSIAAFLS